MSREYSFTKHKKKRKSEQKFPQLLNWIKTLIHTFTKTHTHRIFYFFHPLLWWSEYVYGWWCQGCGLGRSVWMSIKVNAGRRKTMAEKAEAYTYDMSRYLEEFPAKLASPRSSSAPHTTASRSKQEAMTHLGFWEVSCKSFPRTFKALVEIFFSFLLIIFHNFLMHNFFSNYFINFPTEFFLYFSR